MQEIPAFVFSMRSTHSVVDHNLCMIRGFEMEIWHYERNLLEWTVFSCSKTYDYRRSTRFDKPVQGTDFWDILALWDEYAPKALLLLHIWKQIDTKTF